MNQRKKKYTIIGLAVAVLILLAGASWHGVDQSQKMQQADDQHPWNVIESVNPTYGFTEIYMTELIDGTSIRLTFQSLWSEDIETIISIAIFTYIDYSFCSAANGVIEHGDSSIFSVVYENNNLFQSLPGYIQQEVENVISL